ncbi:MAG TPA: hypothetical protein VFK04_16900 [Gemmatimonadaceae bacterium]|nr:hypothetical protein [Gemmatimonadaceae bacterium]
MMRVAELVAAVVASFAIAACSMSTTNDLGPGDTSTSASSATSPSDSDQIAQLEREALALAHNDGCDSAAQCRVAPVGAKACGGPRYWITWCPASTDSAALFKKLDELRTAEQNFNQVHGVISDCSIVGPPTPVVSAGVCRAGP